MSKRVAIIILNYNGYQDTIECVNSILTHIQTEFELVIVDNCSTNDAIVQLNTHKKKNLIWEKVFIIKTKENNGFSAGNNFGIEFANKHFGSDYFWLLNNDTIVKDDALSPLIQKYESNAKSGIIGSKLLFYDQPSVVQALGGRFNKFTGKFIQIGFGKSIHDLNVQEAQEIDFVIGASLFVSKGFLKKVGLLSEDYFLYFEEIDWSIRSHQNGFETLSCLESEVFHKQGSTTKNRANGKRNLKMMYFQFKNLILFYRKYFPGLFFVPFCVITFRCLKLTIKEDRKFLKLWVQVLFQKRKAIHEL